MPLRPRVNVAIDDDLHILTLRYIGALDGEEIYARVMTFFRTLDAPWTYDLIVDVSRLEGVITSSDTEWLGREWERLAAGRDKGRLMAVVSTDPLVIARKGMRDRIFPNFESDVFATRDEALYWIQKQRGLMRADCA